MMNLKGSRILVTGGAGMVGSHVIDRLVTEHPKEIIVLDKNLSCFADNCCPELDYGNVKLLEGDISQVDDVREALRGVDFVVHTAALLGRETNENLRANLEVNICGTFNLVEASVASKVKKFIFSSSIEIYGDPLIEPVTEVHPFNTDSMYGASKIAGELFLKVFKKRNDLNYVALRYPVVYGSRQHYRGRTVQYIPDCFDKIDRGLSPTIYGDGSQQHDYLHAKDVAKANVMALKSHVTGESVNIGTGVSTSIRDVVKMILEITGTSLESVFMPQKEWFGMRSLFLDVTKAEKFLGYRSEVPLREGLMEYYNWRKKKGFSLS